MALKRTRKTLRKAVKVLTDPEPQFVSLVSNGANQTPFRVVKADEAHDGEVVVAGKRSTETDDDSSEDDMKRGKNSTSKKLVVRSTAGTAGADLQRLTFSAEQFDSEQAVRTYLDGNGYEGGEIVALADGGFEVVARDESDFEEVKDIPGDDGVTRYVGVEPETDDEAGTAQKGEAPVTPEGQQSTPASEGKQADTPVEPTAKTDPPAKTEDGGDTPPGGEAENGGGDPAPKTEVAKIAEATFMATVAPEVARKYDEWMAMISSAKDVQSVMANGADGLPPAFHELGGAMVTAMRNALLDGEKDNVGKIATEFGTLVLKLADALDFATIPRELAEKALGEPVDPKQSTQKSAEGSEFDKDAFAKQITESVIASLTGDDGELRLVSKSVSAHSEQLGSTGEELKTLTKQHEDLQETVQKQAQTIETLQRLAAPSRAIEEVDVSSHGLGGTSTARRSGSDDALDQELWKNSMGLS